MDARHASAAWRWAQGKIPSLPVPLFASEEIAGEERSGMHHFARQTVATHPHGVVGSEYGCGSQPSSVTAQLPAFGTHDAVG